MPRKNTDAAAIARWERDHQCMLMRRAGHDWATIVAALGYSSAGHAHDRLRMFMRNYPRADVEELRELELSRIEEKCRELQPRIEKGDVRAVEVWCKLSERRSKLMGLDAPNRREVRVLSRDMVNDAIEQLTAEMTAKAAKHDVDLEELDEEP